MPANSAFWSQLHQIVETVNANGDRTENLRGTIYDLRAMKPADQARALLELNFALLALQELSLLTATVVGTA